MKYILNETPVKTTNNFNINNISIDLDIIETNFNSFDISNINYNEEIKDNYDSKIGLNASKYKEIDINITDNKDVLIKYDFTKNNNYLASKINLNLLDSTSSDITIIYNSEDSSINNSTICINASENSKSNITIINNLNSDSKSFIDIENNLETFSDININFIDIGGNVRVSNYYSNLNGNKCINNFNNIYIGNSKDRIDMNYVISHKGKNTKSNMKVCGSLSDEANKSFKGTIDFTLGSKGSIGCEEENVILLSDTCISKSLPMLLCHEEDVNGSHGVSTGKVDDDKLFYLMSRGIDERTAKKLIIFALFNEIIDNIKNESINKEIVSLIESKI